MNEGQDNANKAGGGSIAGSQGIFSTPELTVDAEKISQANTNTEQKRVASFFANTDAGQRSQKLNNAMGISSQPITEDLVIQNEPKKKSKLPIILAVMVLIAVIGGMVGWIIMSNDEQTSTANVTIEEARQKFDRFATYILFGEEIDSLPDQFQNEEDYKITEELMNPTDQSYWKTASNLLQQALTSYDQVGQNSDDILSQYLGSLQDNFNFLSFYVSYQAPSEQQIITSYVDSGEEIARTYIENYFQNIKDTEAQILETFVEQQILYYDNYLKYIGAFVSAGCISDNHRLSLPCETLYTNAEEQQAMMELSFTLEQAERDIDRFVSDTGELVAQSCWTIDSLFADKITNNQAAGGSNE